MAALQKNIKLQPLSGLILAQQGKLKEASKFIIKAIQINPNYSEAIEHLQLINSSLNMEAKTSDIER